MNFTDQLTHHVMFDSGAQEADLYSHELIFVTFGNKYQFLVNKDQLLDTI